MAVTDWALHKLYFSPHQLLEDHSNGSLRLGSRSESNTVGTAAKFDSFFCSLLPSGQTAELSHEGVKGIKRRLLSLIHTKKRISTLTTEKNTFLSRHRLQGCGPTEQAPEGRSFLLTVYAVTLLIHEHSNHTKKQEWEWPKNLHFNRILNTCLEKCLCIFSIFSLLKFYNKIHSFCQFLFHPSP